LASVAPVRLCIVPSSLYRHHWREKVCLAGVTQGRTG
jgi:hypothetical protein